MQTAKHAKTITKPAANQSAASIKGVQRKTSHATAPFSVQTSALKISSPHDRTEQEADMTAKKVARMPLPLSPVTTRPSDGISRMTSPYLSKFADSGILRKEKKEEEKEKIQRKGTGEGNLSPSVADGISGSMSGGKPLPHGVRSFMEPRFRADFSNVRIHTGESSAKLNRQLNAQAFTVGNHVFFGKDRFRPESGDGKELIAHELTHTVQQEEPSSGAEIQLFPRPLRQWCSACSEFQAR